MRDKGKSPEIPDHSGGEHLLDAMWALRPTRPLPMGGHRAADWPEIWPFLQATGRDFDAWETETLHAMCEAFSEHHARLSPLAYSPVELARREAEKKARPE